ncbi:MAG: orotate phosphoribosyltransferase [Alphaproteobacteria bacterium]|nr:orotate phosphoribosyltransferase [Alphaproteobacteria bacterium]
MAEDPTRVTARLLIETKSVLFRPDDPFIFTSGRPSPVYVDCRRLISFPDARRQLMAMMADQIREAVDVDQLAVVAGGETAGIPFAAWVSELLDLPMVYIRKKPKGFGRNARIEGVLPEGREAILVEDLATDGGSKISFVEGLREAGAECGHTFVIFHYGIFPEGIRTLEKAGVHLHGLATWWDVLDCAEADGSLDSETVAKVREFLEAPDAWGKAHAPKAS